MVASTIGYQDTTLAAFHDTLRQNGVEVLIDVRAIAASRRPGFSKRLLANGIATFGIDYLHLRDLGTPASGRQAAREGRTAEMRAIYEKHLETPEANFAFMELKELVRGGKHICLLCFERDHKSCHRAVLAERLEQGIGAKFIHLEPLPPQP
ncbi:Protein of unknown function, DUF488 [Arboricoccus pini]|uniref:DUF488 domain-containing protein n=1 Tax=Arboricoccus pini TaxID=1963835 RepID=A0A212R875_9PROT|nr:DUF488 domain-containing protein [Arboricoccus pini]SNB68364.1 Protein of unknown function, DUF488 [Arboricoccus pini]